MCPKSFQTFRLGGSKMSLELFVSSPECSAIRPENVLKTIQFPCNVTRIWSSVFCNAHFEIEAGFHFKFWSMTNQEFKQQVWPQIEDQLKITCAFIIKQNEYMGCLLNWPDVFVSTCCTNKCTSMVPRSHAKL